MSARRQPMRAFSFTNRYNADAPLGSPHDSLATDADCSRGSTGYFLRFDDVDHKAVSPKKQPAAKTTSSPKKPKLATKTPPPVSKKPTSPIKKPSTAVNKPVRSPTNKTAPASKLNSTPTGKAHHKPSISSALYKPTISSALKATATTAKKQAPPVKPKPTVKSKSKIPVKETVKTTVTRGRTAVKPQNDGFRTRSVSLKVLKRDDNEGAKDELLYTVADKCEEMLKNVQTDSDHFEQVMQMRKVVSANTNAEPVSEESIETNSNHSFVGQADARPIAKDEDKSANINSNNNQWERLDAATERPSKLVGSEDSIDLAATNQLDNTRVDCQPPLVREDIGARLPEETLISSVESVKSDKTEQSKDTASLLSERNSVSELHRISDNFYQSEPGCQELGKLTNSRAENLTAQLTPDNKNETEREGSIDHGASVVGTHLTQSPEYDVVEPLERQREQVEKDRAATTTTMASSWMDRLKEDLDNDDEWLSDEEELQREQEAQLRAAAQRKALAEEESLSDDEHPPPLTRVQGHNEPERDSGSDWSDDEVGFQGRNDPLRKSMNRNNYSGDEYSTDEEVAMVAGAHREPDQEEMDMMVKRNLAYVNSRELDQMDIMTSDLDVPPEQLQLQAGEGEMVRPDEASALYSFHQVPDSGFDAKEDNDEENHIEVVGTLEVVSDSDIQPEHRDVNKWSDSNITDYSSHLDTDHSFDDRNREATRTEFISALAEELKESDRQEMSGKADSPGGNYVDEDLVSPDSKGELEVTRTQHYHDQHINEDADEHSDGSSPVADYDTQVIRPGRSREWRKQLSQKLNEWEDELPSPGRQNAAGFESRDEAVTSFMSEEDEEKDDVDHAPTGSPPTLDRSKSTEDEIREKVEGSMQEKIRDWKNMTAESASGQVEEWQSLGNFNVPSEQSRRRGHEDADDDDVPAEKRRDQPPVSQARQDSGDYADINTIVHHSTSYDGDVEGDDTEDGGAIDIDEEGDGYVSDSSSQDTVRERSMQRQAQLEGSVSDEDGAMDGPSSKESAGDPTQEPGYVEILGGEEPPDEWMNLGTRRERISSSSSNGSGFEYIAGGQQYPQEPANIDSADDEDNAMMEIPALISRSSRERLATPPIDLPVASHPAVEDIMQKMEYNERQNTTPPAMTEEPSPVEEVKAMDVETVEVVEEPMSPTAGEEVLTEDEVETVPDDVNEKLSSPEPAAENIPVENRAMSSSSSSSASEADAPVVSGKAPEPTTRTDSFDRVEKLREEMRSAANSGQSQSFDLQTTRQSRSTDRFTERMKSLENTKALREKKTPKPTGLTGKFSSVFSRFETSDDLPKRKPAIVQIGRSKSMGPSTRHRAEKAADPVEPINPTKSKQAKTKPETKQEEKPQTTESRKSEPKNQQPAKAEPKAKRIERSKTFDTGVPSRSPGGSKVLERMARLGLSMEIPMEQQRTVTTKNQDTERFERHTVEGRDKVKVEQLSKKGRPAQEKRDEYLNVWDTEVPVTDGNRKILSSKRLHVSSVSKEIKTTNAHDSAAERPLSRSTSEPRLRRKAPTLQTEEISITVRPQHSTSKSSRNSNRPDSQGDKEEQGRMRSSIALQPTDEVIQAKQSARQHASAPRQRSPSPRKYHERNLPLKKADSLDELRTGQLVAQCKGLFNNEEMNPEKYMPANQQKLYPNRKSEQFVRGSSEQSWDNRHRERQDMMSDAVRELTDAYDQMEDDYNTGYSRESLEYTRKWIENNETTPPNVAMHQNRDYEQEKIADPVRDDAAFRRMQQANRSLPKHFTDPTRVTMSSASPDTSVISDRGRARSTDRGEVRQPRVGRPKGRSRSLPRRKPAKAIADRASLFSNPSDEQGVHRQDIDEHIRSASAGRHLRSSNNRRSASPRTVTQKERLANRRSMPAQQREPNEVEQGSPRAASKGVAIMVELYNKSKGGDSALADVDEQTLASVDDAMFRQRGGPVTSPSVENAPQSKNAWKAWHGHHEKSPLEQKVENAYQRHTQQAGPPIKRDNKPAVNSGWQQRSIHEERMVIPTNASRSYNAVPQPSPPRPAKSDLAMDIQRRGWSASPPAPAVPQRGYAAEPGHPGIYNNGHIPDAAFDNYKQQTLQKFKQEEQYATVQRPGRPESSHQLQLNAPSNFDQALLMQAPPPKPERLYNRVEPWEAYPPNEYPTTNSLQGYPAKPSVHYPSDSRAPARYPEERQQYQGYPPERQPSLREPRQREHPPPQQRQSYPVPHTRYDDRGYPTQQPPPQQQQQYREPSYSSQPKQNYPGQQSYREPGYDSRSYAPAGDPYSNGYGEQRRREHAHPDQVDSYRQVPRKEPRYPHEQPPRGPIPDPRYGMRSPPPQQADPRYGAYDPKMESGHQPPRRTNSVPNIKQQVTSPSKSQPPQAYNPRYNDQYIDDRQRAPPPPHNSGSLSRSGKQKDKSKKKPKNKTDLPEFTPIQYATGKIPPKHSAQNGYGYSTQPLNNNYPPTANNNRYTHSGDQGYSPHSYSSNGHGYPPSGHSYPSGGYPSHGHPAYPHDDPYHSQKTRPGVGIIYNPDLGISDF